MSIIYRRYSINGTKYSIKILLDAMRIYKTEEKQIKFNTFLLFHVSQRSKGAQGLDVPICAFINVVSNLGSFGRQISDQV